MRTLVVMTLVTMSVGWADINGSRVTGFYSNVDGSTNLFDPANGAVPATGYSNSPDNFNSPQVVVSTKPTFGYVDANDLLVASFSGTQLTITETARRVSCGCEGGTFEFRDVAFSGISLASSTFSTFFGPITFAVSGNLITIHIPRQIAGQNPGQVWSATFNITTPTGFCDILPNAEYIVNGTSILKFDPFGNFISQFGGTGSGPGQFQLPSGIAVSNKEFTPGFGTVWVADANLNRVQGFDTCGNLVRQFGLTGTGPGFLYQPYGIAVDGSGNVWVADTGNNRIEQFSPTGVFLQQYGTIGGGDGQFFHPTSIVADRVSVPSALGSSIWVSDTGNNRIQQLRIPASGSPLAFVSKQGGFNGPFSIGFDYSFGGLYVADSGNQRIIAFDYGAPPPAPFLGQINGFSYPSPYGLAVDVQNPDTQFLVGTYPVRIWAVDYNASKVMVFNAAGAKLFEFGTVGGGPGQFFHPTFIAVYGGFSPV